MGVADTMHGLTLELEEVFDRQIDVPSVAYILYGLLAFVEQEKILLVDGDAQFIHGRQDLFVKALGRGDNLAVAVLLTCEVGFHVIARRTLVHGEEKVVLGLLPDNHGNVRFDDDGMTCGVDFQRGCATACHYLVENRVRWNLLHYVREPLSFVDGYICCIHL